MCLLHRSFTFHTLPVQNGNNYRQLTYTVWMELGRAAKNSKKGKRVIRRWRLDRFGDDEVKLRYQNGLRAEVHGFSESIKRKVEGGMT